MRTLVLCGVVAVAVAAVVSCGSGGAVRTSGGGDAMDGGGQPDATPPADGGSPIGPDGGEGDGGAPDAGAPDAGTPDGGAPDGGDGGSPDAGRPAPGMQTFGFETFPGGILSVGVDEAENVWAVDGPSIWVAPKGGSFRSFAGVGQLGAGFPSQTICGGAAGKAYVGYWAPEIANPVDPPPEVTAQGDLDRVALDAHGDVVLEHHYNILNSNSSPALWFDETRSILTCLCVDDGPYQGELYIGSNHAATRIRGDAYADHRHVVFDWPPGSGSLAIGPVHGLALALDGALLLASEWKFGKIQPTPNLLDWLQIPFDIDGFPEMWAPLELSSDWVLQSIAQAPDERYWVGTLRRGLFWFDWWYLGTPAAPRHFVTVANAPDSSVTAIVPEPDGSLWIGTGSHGVWRYVPEPRPTVYPAPPESGTWTALDGLPGQQVRMIHLETRFGARQLYIATDGGLAVYTEP